MKERYNNSETAVCIRILAFFQCYVQLSESTKLWLSSLHSSGSWKKQFESSQDKKIVFVGCKVRELLNNTWGGTREYGMFTTDSNLASSVFVVMKMVLCYSCSCFVPIMLKLTSKLTPILIHILFHIYRRIDAISNFLISYGRVCVGFVCGFF